MGHYFLDTQYLGNDVLLLQFVPQVKLGLSLHFIPLDPDPDPSESDRIHIPDSCYILFIYIFMNVQ